MEGGPLCHVFITTLLVKWRGVDYRFPSRLSVSLFGSLSVIQYFLFSGLFVLTWNLVYEFVLKWWRSSVTYVLFDLVMPPKWNLGASIFWPFCSSLFLSVCATKKFYLRHNFWTIEIETSNLACTLNLWNAFNSYQGQWPCDLDYDLYAKTCHQGHLCFTSLFCF